jgi:phosphoglycolate phosphatase
VSVLLLDLDGTLVDTAPDMVASLNALLVEEGRPPVPFERARGEVSNGAAGLLRLGFATGDDDPEFERWRRRFLELYAGRVADESRLFNGFDDVWQVLSELGWRWGVVTNKPAALAAPLLARLALAPDGDCLVGGDSLPERKPHPAPLLHAAERLGCAPETCWYVGDHARDVEAGRAAGMTTVAVSYGYLAAPAEARDWGADHVVDSPSELATTLRRAGRNARRAG